MLRLPFVAELPLTSERLELRAFERADFEALLAFHSSAEAVRYVPFGPRTPEAMDANLERKISGKVLRDAGDLLEMAVTLGARGRLIGDLLMSVSSIAHATIEVGYLFHPDVVGRGYATEAVCRLLDFTFDALGAHRVIARIDSRNATSIALCERIGMRLEARQIEAVWFKDEWTTEVDYAVLHREWGELRGLGGRTS